jgi:hypothetical protein
MKMAYEEQREKSRRMMSVTTSLLDFFLGLLMIAVGIILYKRDHFQIRSISKFANDRDPFLIQLFGGICILYGAWRIFRGYQKVKNQ